MTLHWLKLEQENLKNVLLDILKTAGIVTVIVIMVVVMSAE